MSRRSVFAVALVVLLQGCDRAPERPVARLAVDPAEVELAHPGAARVEISWTPLTPLGDIDGELRVFVHLLDDRGEISRTFDHPYPFDWEVGRQERHRLELYESMLGPALPAGEYALTVGLYDASGRRWSLETTGEDLGQQEYRVATVRVRPPAPGTSAPEIEMTGGWLPLEAGGDRQILGRRWLRGAAAIEVHDAGSAGELVLWLTVPPAPEGVELRTTGARDQPQLRLAADCDGSEHLLAGTGDHRVAVRVDAGESCRLTLEPGFELIWPEGPPRAGFLENLYWRG